MAQYDGSIIIKTDIDAKNAAVQLAALENRIEKTADKVASLRSKMDLLKNAKIPTQEYKDISAQIEKAEQKFNKLLEKQEQMQREGKDNGVQWQRLNDQINEVGNEIRYAQGELQDLVDTGKAFTLGTDTDEYVQMTAQMEKLTNQMQSDQQRAAELQSAIVADEEHLAQIRENAVVNDQRIVDAMERKKQLLQEISDMERAGLGVGHQQYNSAQQELSQLNQEIRDYRNGAEEIRSSYVRLSDAVKNAFAMIGRGLIDIPIAAAKKGADGLLSVFSSFGNTAKNAIGKIAKGLASLPIATVKKGVAGLLSMFSRLGSVAKNTFFKLGKGAPSANKGFSGVGLSLKNILKYAFGIRSLFALVNKLRSAIKEGFANLYNENTKFKRSVDELKASALTLKNAFAAAFRPLVEVAIPYIQRVLDYMAKLVDAAGQVMAALMGQKKYTKAIKQTADAFEDAEEAADGYLSPLDEINKYQTSDSKKDQWEEGTMFEEVPISDKFKDIAQWLKDMWKNADFTELGSMLGQKLKDTLDKIPWDSIKEKARKLGKSLATLINGFVEVPGLGESIGRTLAEAINTGFEFLNAFVHNLHWDSIGNFIADSINGALKNIDWNLIYDTFVTGAKGLSDAINSFSNRLDWSLLGESIGKGINTIVDTINAFVDNTDWQGLGSRIATGLNSMFNTINPENLGKSLSQKIRIIIETAYGFVTTFDWSKFGTWIGKTIQGFFNNIDFALAAKTLSEGLIGAFNGLTAAIAAVDWYGLGQKVKEFLVNIDWAEICDAMFEALGAALAGLALFIWGIIEDAWNSVVEWWHDVAYEDGKFTIKGLLEGIWEAIKNIGAWIKEHIFQPFIDGFKSVFGIHSPSTVMKEQGGYIISGLLDGILEKIKNIGAWIKEHIFTPFIDGFKKVFDINSPSKVMEGMGGFIVSGLLEGLKDKWKDITDWIEQKIQWVKDKFGGIGDTISGLFGSSGKSTVSYSISGIKVPVSPVVAALSNVEIPAYATGQVIPRTMKQHLAILGDNTKETEVVSPLSTIEQAVENAISKIGSIGGNGTIIIKQYLDGRQITEAVIKEGKIQQMSTGSNIFMLGET